MLKMRGTIDWTAGSLFLNLSLKNKESEILIDIKNLSSISRV